MMTSFELRRAEAADLPALCAIEAACFSDPWSEGALASHLDNSATLTLVATADGRAVGALLLGLCPPEAEIYRIATLPDARRLGIGRALLSRGLDALREAGVTKIFLDVREGNTPARTLYATHGFRETGVRRDYYRAPRENAVLMEREV